MDKSIQLAMEVLKEKGIKPLEYQYFYEGRTVKEKSKELIKSDEGERFRVLTKYIEKISAASLGEWNDKMPEVRAFRREFYQFSESHPEYELTRYREILENHGWKVDEMCSVNLQDLDAKSILALIMGVIRSEYFGYCNLYNFFNDGSLTAWLKRLKDIDISVGLKVY